MAAANRRALGNVGGRRSCHCSRLAGVDSNAILPCASPQSEPSQTQEGASSCFDSPERPAGRRCEADCEYGIKPPAGLGSRLAASCCRVRKCKTQNPCRPSGAHGDEAMPMLTAVFTVDVACVKCHQVVAGDHFVVGEALCRQTSPGSPVRSDPGPKRWHRFRLRGVADRVQKWG